MKKRFFVLIISLIVALCAGLALAGCDLIFNFNANHTHIAASEWESDSTYHWHECTVIGCTEQVDKAEHTLEHTAAKQVTCTEDGNNEYWYCSGCGKYFADANATTEISVTVLTATGHSPVLKYDGENHWQECEICHTVLVSAQAHASSVYIKNKSGHYKICTECGVKFDIGTHTEGEDCSVCGYTVNYADKCSSDYGYNYLGTLEGGAAYQSFYESIDEVASAFHGDNTKTASSITVGTSNYFVVGEVNYASLGLSLNQAESVWATYRNDHPLYYWLSGQTVYNSQMLSLCVDEDYKSGSVRTAQNELLYNAIDEYLNSVGGETSAYQIAFALHDRIIDSIDYALDENGYPQNESWAHCVLGAFIVGEAVCEGYAKAFSLLLNACGVDNVYVTGTSKGEGHAWNIVKIDGNWYWYDLTWDDQPKIGGGIIYKYMCKADSEFIDHTVGITGDFNDPMNFLYAVPTAATSEYNTSLLEYGEQFTADSFTYEVCGYNKVSVIASDTSLAGEVILPDSVTYGMRSYSLAEIGKGAFTDNKKITALTIPQAVRVIYNFAVKGCSALTSVKFADKVGWSRKLNDEVTQISNSSLESPTYAATLLKDTYSSGSYIYQYVWTKSV
ncbi:MAG: transglutaminase domain-containing protein [Candidatus Coproplasma sp.]